MSVQPRLLWPKDAWVYLGVNRNFFNQHVRPSLTDVRFGKQSVAFDRNELDAWADNAVKTAKQGG